MTRYRYNDIPLDTNGRYFYITDGDTTWNPGFKPMKTKLDKYECHHGFGYTRICSAKNSLAADVLFMVPNGENCEVQMVTLTNEGKKDKNISWFLLLNGVSTTDRLTVKTSRETFPQAKLKLKAA